MSVLLIERCRSFQESQRAATLGGIALSILLRGLRCRKSQGEKPGSLEDSSPKEQSPDPLSRPVPHSRLPGTSSSPTRPVGTGAPSPPPPHSLAWPTTRPLRRRAGTQLCSTGSARRKTGPWAEPGAPPLGSASPLSELVFALRQFRPSWKLAGLEMESRPAVGVFSRRVSGTLRGICGLRVGPGTTHRLEYGVVCFP